MSTVDQLHQMRIVENFLEENKLTYKELDAFYNKVNLEFNSLLEENLHLKKELSAYRTDTKCQK